MELAFALMEHQRWLWTVVYSRLGDRAATEDVMQEISVAAVKCERSAEANAIREVKGWLYQVAIRQVMLFRRKEARDRAKLGRLAEFQQDGGSNAEQEWQGPGGLELLSRLEQSELVRHALAGLRPSDRQILVMKYHDEMSCREISDQLGVAESTIQSRLLRARRKLRSILLASDEFQEFRQ